MAFKDDIITQIKLVADTYGSDEVKRNLGTNGKVWRPSPNEPTKLQSYVVFIEGLADAIVSRTITRSAPFNGALLKTVLNFISPNQVVFNNTNGVMTGDTFNVTGSLYNNGGKEVLSVSGNSVTVRQGINTELNTEIAITIGPPSEDLNIEDTIKRIQACIGDAIPIAATETRYGLIKKAASVDLFPAPSNVAQTKLNEILTALKNATIMA